MSEKHIYMDEIQKINDEIDKYYDNVDKLWNDVIVDYKESMNSGIILDKLDVTLDKNKFYKLMSNTSVIRYLFESRKRLELLLGNN